MRKKDFALWVLLAVFAFVLMAGGCGGGGGDGNSWTAGTVDFSDLAGSYTAQPGGSGILTINGERIDLTLLSANAVISSIQSSGTNSASAILSAESEVEAYYGGSTLDTFSETHEDETITITRTDDNKFKWADPDGGGTTELTITGVGQADVTQSGSFYYSGDYYQYTLTYSMTKTSY